MGKKEADMLCSCFMWSHVVSVTQDQDMCTLDIIHVWIRMFLSCCSSTQHHKNNYTVTLDKATPKEMQKQPQILSEIPTIFSGFPALDMIYWVTNPQCISFLCPRSVSPWAHVRFCTYSILWGNFSQVCWLVDTQNKPSLEISVWFLWSSQHSLARACT